MGTPDCTTPTYGALVDIVYAYDKTFSVNAQYVTGDAFQLRRIESGTTIAMP